MKYDVVIGLEVHVQLNTKSKLFCSCKNKFGALANANTCPICQGHPGVLPVLNSKAVTKAVSAGIALNCSISNFSKFDRKNYFYPDLPKAYQITQYDLPICTRGYLDINIDENSSSTTKRININRIHIEEDAGKLIHSNACSFVDLNRCGVPLLEIVSEPDMKTSKEAYLYLNDLKSIMSFVEVSDCNMEEGSLRCDANVSIRESEDSELGVKVEIKNLNSFKSVQKSIDYEIKRQEGMLLKGKGIIQETRLYNVDENMTYAMRSKGDADDYRYYTEPDLVPVILKDEEIKRIRATLPELPKAKQSRFIKDYNLSLKDVLVLTSSTKLSDYFEKSLSFYPSSPKKTANWITAEFMRALQKASGDFSKVWIGEKHIADIVRLIDSGTISGKIGKLIFDDIVALGKDGMAISVERIIKDKGLKLISNEDDLSKAVAKVLEDNPKAVLSFKNGKENVLGFLVGQVMKATKGQAKPALVNKLLKQELKI